MTDPTLFSASNSGQPPEGSPESKTATAVLEPPQPTVPPAGPNRVQVWMHRISVFLFVLVSAVAGVLLIILPWTTSWTDNYLLLSFPNLRPVIANSFFRGVCSGLGILDIWIGFWEALHYHEQQ
jgi:hypothetical protein